MLIWTALAALALALFAGMSVLALANRAAPPMQGEPAPAHTPHSPGDEPTPPVSSSGAEESGATPTPAEGAATTPSSDPTAVLGLWLSAVSALSALIGLASSLWLGWRKESREAAHHQLELEKARLEIRKLEQELASAGGPMPDADSRGG